MHLIIGVVSKYPLPLTSVRSSPEGYRDAHQHDADGYHY